MIVLFPIYITVVNSLLAARSDRGPAADARSRPTPTGAPTRDAWSAGSRRLVPLQLLRRHRPHRRRASSSRRSSPAYAFAFLEFPLKRTDLRRVPHDDDGPVRGRVLHQPQTDRRRSATCPRSGSTSASTPTARSRVPFLATGFGAFLVRQAFLSLPRDLRDAAALDGYGHLRFMARVAVPLSAARRSRRSRCSRSSRRGTSTSGRWSSPTKTTARCRSGCDNSCATPELRPDQRHVRRYGAGSVAAVRAAARVPEAARAGPHRRRREGMTLETSCAARISFARRRSCSSLAACGGGDDDDDTGGSGGDGGGEAPEAPDLPECPLDALESADQPVEITLWHAMTRANEEAARARSPTSSTPQQDDVEVTLSASPSYTDNRTRYTRRAGHRRAPRPRADRGHRSAVHGRQRSRCCPAASCIAADNYDMSDLIERVVSYYTVDDVLWPMPFNVSNPILYYNKAAFEQAGLDPEAAADDARRSRGRRADDRRQRRDAVRHRAARPRRGSSSTGSARPASRSSTTSNGRTERATAVDVRRRDRRRAVHLDRRHGRRRACCSRRPTARSTTTSRSANEQAAMTIDTSAALGTIAQVLGQGQFAAVELGVGPMPGPDSPDGGVLVGGAALYIVNQSAPEKQAAAYEFAKCLTSPSSKPSGPRRPATSRSRQSAATMSPLAERWTEEPGYKIAYDQLLDGADERGHRGSGDRPLRAGWRRRARRGHRRAPSDADRRCQPRRRARASGRGSERRARGVQLASSSASRSRSTRWRRGRRCGRGRRARRRPGGLPRRRAAGARARRPARARTRRAARPSTAARRSD